ncbi:MAG: SDR family oxidoreductase [Betaproteobacteria bacterium]|nr:SDR family oxidoreductase [Betaproteobacteria bacterium]
MDLKGKIAVITGAASGIGKAAALRFRQEGAAGIVLGDLSYRKSEETAEGFAVPCDVSKEADLQRLVREAEARFGRVDVFFSNAGIFQEGGLEAPDADWERNWKIHVMAHVYAARAVVEKMAVRGSGYFIVTASAAGLLNIVESATYGVTKRGSVAIAEWIAIAYGRRGVRVSCLCPQGVLTNMFRGDGGSAGVDGVLTTDDVMEELIKTMREERFLVLPHPKVLDYLRGKSTDYDRWLGGMQKLFLRHRGGK